MFVDAMIQMGHREERSAVIDGTFSDAARNALWGTWSTSRVLQHPLQMETAHGYFGQDVDVRVKGSQ